MHAARIESSTFVDTWNSWNRNDAEQKQGMPFLFIHSVLNIVFVMENVSPRAVLILLVAQLDWNILLLLLYWHPNVYQYVALQSVHTAQ